MFTRNELIALKLLHRHNVDHDYIIAMKFLKKWGFNDKLAFEMAYLYNANYQENSDYENVKNPERLSYEEYMDNIADEIKVVMKIVDDNDPENFEFLSNRNVVIHGGREFKVFDSEESATKYAIEYTLGWICDDVSEEVAETYVEIWSTDRRLLAQDMTDHIYDEMDDEDIIHDADIEDEIEAINYMEEEAGKIGSQIDELQIKLKKVKSAKTKENIVKMIKQLTSQLKEEYGKLDFDNRRETLIEDARNRLREEEYERVEQELKDNPVHYFVHEQGIYSLEDLLKQSFIHIDCDQLAKDHVNESSLSDVMDGEEHTVKMGDKTYYVYDLNF